MIGANCGAPVYFTLQIALARRSVTVCVWLADNIADLASSVPGTLERAAASEPVAGKFSNDGGN